MHHLVQNQSNLTAVNQAQSLKTISIGPRIFVSTWAYVLKKKNPHNWELGSHVQTKWAW